MLKSPPTLRAASDAARPGRPATFFPACPTRAVARAVVDLVEALLLQGHVGRELSAAVVASGDGRSTIVLRQPAVQTDLAQELPLGEEIRVRVEGADPIARTVDLAPL